MNKVKRTRTNKTTLEYSLNGVSAQVRDCPHGRRSYGFGNWGYQYAHILTLYKDGKQLTNYGRSLKRGTWRSWIAALVEALATEPNTCPYCNRLSFFFGKFWTVSKWTRFVHRFGCERCGRPQYGDDDYSSRDYYTSHTGIEIQSRYYPDSVFNRLHQNQKEGEQK